MKDKIWTFSTWLWLLALAIVATIYGAWLIYPLEIDFFHLEQVVYLSKETIYYNFNILMSYLTNPFSTVLDMPSFSSSASGLGHFRDVKHLFQIAQAILLLLAYPSWRFLKQAKENKSFFLHEKAFISAAVVPIIVGLMAVLIGFDNFFTMFHEVLFPGDSSWLFNPATDPIIWVLPEEFFLHCFALFFALYEVIMISLVVIGRRQLKKRTDSKDN